MEKLLNKLADRIVDQLNAERLRQMMMILPVSSSFAANINSRVEEQIRWQEHNLPLVRRILQQYAL